MENVQKNQTLNYEQIIRQNEQYQLEHQINDIRATTQQDFLKINMINQALNYQITQLKKEIKELEEKLTNHKNQKLNTNNSIDQKQEKKYRFRRQANDIERSFKCKCGKSYGSEGSLQQHIKTKHENNRIVYKD